MQVVYTRCAGLDVHKKTVSACISVCEANGVKQQQTRAFGTFTHDLLMLADWLKERGVTHVTMEATGVYWRPVWAMLEGQFEQMLVNPQHIKAGAVSARAIEKEDSATAASARGTGAEASPISLGPIPGRVGCSGGAHSTDRI